jgi:predicted nucleic acid-binding Zn ribbon protein
MNNLGDYLGKKGKSLQLDRANDLQKIQTLLDKWYPGKARAISLNNGVLRISTQSSSVANELRFKKQEIQTIVPAVTKTILR